jgi:hypothetical protein
MVAPFFNKRYGIDDLAFREGRRPGDGAQQGPEAERISDPRDFARFFAGQIKNNPDAGSMYDTDVFSAETAAASQQKINVAGATDLPDRGLVKPEDAITKERLSVLMTQPATTGTNSKMEDTVGKFPSQGVKVG